jgi:glycosyltransferase involved in cell wall biosynthesis
MTFANRNRGGSGVYARSLLAALGERDDVAVWEIAGPRASGLAGTLRWLTGGARAALAARPPQLVHCPTFITPWRLPAPFVVTVHDAGVYRFPADHPLEWRAYDRVLLTRRLHSASRVIAVSEFARREVIEGYRLDPDRVVAVPNGVDDRFRAEPEFRSEVAGDPRMLFPGAPLGHKNLDAVLRAMAAADPHSALGRAGLDISGAEAATYPALSAEVGRLGLRARVRWLGSVAAEAMPGVYRAAALVVYPSLYEGFGLPPLEAMAAGTPVVASNRGPLPEVLGDSALLVDPSSTELAEALEAVLTRPEVRERLIAAGRRRAARYTWSRCAEKTVEVYRAAVADARR